MYKAKNIETGAVVEMTEEQVRAEIADTYKCDMGIVFGDGATDEEIDQATQTDDLADHFQGNVFEGSTYEITKLA